MSSPHQVDLPVIGSGASGMTTVARAAQAGARVRVVEAGALLAEDPAPIRSSSRREVMWRPTHTCEHFAGTASVWSERTSP